MENNEYEMPSSHLQFITIKTRQKVKWQITSREWYNG